MSLNQLIGIKTKSKKRIGRGIGSGRGKTSGRGTKGQKARGKVPAAFSGSVFPIYRVLPLKRGYGNPKTNAKPIGINLDKLTVFKNGSVIDQEALIKAGLIKPGDSKRRIKILGNGEIKNNLTVKVPISKSAQQKIENAGGKVE